MAVGQREDGASPESPLSRLGHAVASGTILAIASLISYWLITAVLTREYFVSRDDDLLGGMWASMRCRMRKPRSGTGAFVQPSSIPPWRDTWRTTPGRIPRGGSHPRSSCRR